MVALKSNMVLAMKRKAEYEPEGTRGKTNKYSNTGSSQDSKKKSICDIDNDLSSSGGSQSLSEAKLAIFIKFAQDYNIDCSQNVENSKTTADKTDDSLPLSSQVPTQSNLPNLTKLSILTNMENAGNTDCSQDVKVEGSECNDNGGLSPPSSQGLTHRNLPIIVKKEKDIKPESRQGAKKKKMTDDEKISAYSDAWDAAQDSRNDREARGLAPLSDDEFDSDYDVLKATLGVPSQKKKASGVVHPWEVPDESTDEEEVEPSRRQKAASKPVPREVLDESTEEESSEEDSDVDTLDKMQKRKMLAEAKDEKKKQKGKAVEEVEEDEGDEEEASDGDNEDEEPDWDPYEEEANENPWAHGYFKIPEKDPYLRPYEKYGDPELNDSEEEKEEETFVLYEEPARDRSMDLYNQMKEWLERNPEKRKAMEEERDARNAAAEAKAAEAALGPVAEDTPMADADANGN